MVELDKPLRIVSGCFRGILGRNCVKRYVVFRIGYVPQRLTYSLGDTVKSHRL